MFLGPFALAYLLFADRVAIAAPREPLMTTVEYFVSIGLIQNKDDLSIEELAKKISKKYSVDWGKNFDEDDRFTGVSSDLEVLKYIDGRIWWKDTEADVLKGNNVYVQTLKEWSAISNGGFKPSNIVEKWETDIGPIELKYQLDGRGQVITPEYMEDYIDMKILRKINELLPNNTYKFEMLTAFDQTAVVLWIESQTKAALIKRGWRFAW